MEIRCLGPKDEEYPDLLKKIKNPPEKLFVRGETAIFDQPCLAVVGARKSTNYGKWAAYEIAKTAAAHGITVVSGLAMGIDSAAHRGALTGGGVTAAVLAGGVDICYPAGNRSLMDRILERGAVLSEQPPGQQSFPGLFPARNRIISGLCTVTTVVEAEFKSGSLITAGLALEQNREVCAVPGNINSPASLGTNKLIQDGAIPLIVPHDILSVYGIPRDPGNDPKLKNLGRDEKMILEILMRSGELTLGQLCEKCTQKAGDVAGIVTVLEIKGVLQTAMGKIFVAKI